MKGEFEKHATSIHEELAKLKGGESTAIKNLVSLDVINEARKRFPQFKDFTHGLPDDLTAEDFLDPDIINFADLYGYVTAQKEFKKKWFGSKEVTK